MTEILDCSRYQGQPDWRQVAASGVKAVILKATEGTSYKYVSWFLREAERAKQAGLSVMAYHFANPNTDPKAQALYFARTCEGRLSDPYQGLPTHWLDIESGSGSQLGWVRGFLAELHKLTGRTPGYYSYAPHIDMTIPDSATDLRVYPLWLAAYRSKLPPTPAPWQRIALWQYTSSGSVPGIEGRVDCNHVVTKGATTVPTTRVTPALPAVGRIVDALPAPYGGCWLLAEDGAIYTTGKAVYLGGMNDLKNRAHFVGRTAARLHPFEGGYQIEATSGERYVPTR